VQTSPRSRRFPYARKFLLVRTTYVSILLSSYINSGAAHDFMSLACAQKTNLSLEKMEVLYLILRPGGRVVVDRMVCKIPIKLVRQVFPTNILILKGQGIDIILGMRWMKMHKALLDISTRLVHLDSPANDKLLCIYLSCLVFRLLFTSPLRRVWRRFSSFRNIRMYSPTNCRECLPTELLNSGLSCSLVRLSSRSDRTKCCQMN
jgi:hypothetical protein